MTTVNRLRVVYEINDSQFIAGMNRMKQASREANDAIVKAVEDIERKQAGGGKGAKAAATIMTAAAADTVSANKEVAGSVQQVVKANDDMAASYKRSSDQMQDTANTNVASVQRLIDGNIKSAQSNKIAEESWRSMSAEIDRLEAKYNPAAMAAQQYKQAVEEVNRAHKLGIISTEQHQKVLKAMQVEFTRTGSVMGVFRQNIGNMSYQVQDMAAQLSMGADAMIVMGQQVPQLLVGFGSIGASLGLVAALAFPAISLISKLGGETEDLGKQLKDLTSALDGYKSTLDSAIGPMDDLVERFGKGATAARETYEALLEIERITYLKEMSDTVGSLAEKMRGLSDAVERWQTASKLPEWMREEAIAGAASATQELQDQFGLTVVEANRVATAMKRLGEARSQGPSAAADAARDLADNLMTAYEAGGSTNETLLDAAKSAYEMSVNAREAAQIMGDVSDSSISAADAASAASDATANWAATMAGVRAEINAIASALSQMGGGLISNASKFVELNALKQGSTVAEASRARQRAQMEAEFAAQEAAAGTWAERLLVKGQRALANQGLELDDQLDAARSNARETAQTSGKVKGGRSGSGRSGAAERPLFENLERDTIQLERQLEVIGKTSEEVATMEARWAMLDEAKRRGVQVNETLNGQIEAQAAKVGALTAELERAEISHEQFADGIGTIVDALFEAGNAGENFAERLKNSLIDAGLQASIASLKSSLTNLFTPAGGGGGFLGNFLGNIFSKTPSFEGGGFTGTGARSGGIDGVGGFPAIIHPNETVIDHTKGQRSGGSQSVAMTIDLRGTTGDKELDRKIAQAGQRILSQVPAVMDNVNKRQR